MVALEQLRWRFWYLSMGVYRVFLQALDPTLLHCLDFHSLQYPTTKFGHDKLSTTPALLLHTVPTLPYPMHSSHV